MINLMQFTEKRPYNLTYTPDGRIECVITNTGKKLTLDDFVQVRQWEVEAIDGFLFIGDSIEVMIAGELVPLESIKKVFG